MPWLKANTLAPSQVLTARSNDGLAIESYLTLPPGSRKRPLVVMPHGGPVGVSDSLRFDCDTQFLASLGYAVLRVKFVDPMVTERRSAMPAMQFRHGHRG